MLKKIMTYITPEQELYNLNINTNISRGTLTEIHISDIHFGSINPETEYKILKEQFINKIVNLNFDLLSINGDLFKHKFMSNSEPVLYASLFINELVNICRVKNATLIIIHGTNYHDASQLKLFYHYLKDPTIDIRIVEEVKFEYVKGAKILCIPELYGMGEDYYNQFLLQSGYYDAVFMHGAIKGAIYSAQNQESGIHSDKAPTFTIDDFCCCKGLIISGHVHTPGCFNGYFYYTGSPIRSSFGEEEEKGFLVVLHNLDTQQHYVKLEPIQSFRYDTINLNHMLLSDPKDVISYITSLQENNIDYIRIKFDNIIDEQSIANINLIKQYYKLNPRVKIHASIEKKDKLAETLEDKYKEYEYILDKSLSEYEILTRYINQKEDCIFITVDELKSIIEEEF